MFSLALVAGPPSPIAELELPLPPPANVVIVPVDDTFWTRPVNASAKYRLPELSNANAQGPFAETTVVIVYPGTCAGKGFSVRTEQTAASNRVLALVSKVPEQFGLPCRHIGSSTSFAVRISVPCYRCKLLRAIDVVGYRFLNVTERSA